MGGISADRASKATKDEVGKTMQQLVRQNHTTLKKTIASVRDKTITFLDDQFFSNPKQIEFWTGIDTLGELSEAEAILDRWSADGTQYTLYMKGTLEQSLPFDARYKSKGFLYTREGSPGYPEWADETRDEKGAGTVRLTGTNTGRPSVSFTRSILHPERYEETIGFLVVSDLDGLLANDLLSVRLPEHASIYLFNDEGELLMKVADEAPDWSALPEPARTGADGYDFATADGKQWLYAYSRDDTFRTRLIYRIPVESIVGSQSAFQWTILIMSGVYLVFVLLFVLYLIRDIVKPIARLVRFTKLYEPGKPFDFGKPPKGNDEFRLLHEAFIRMTARLDQSIEENYGMKIRQKEMELSALHSQITPHLLYNTLDSIYWYAVDSGKTDIGSMVKDLSKLLRIGLSKGKSMVTIAEETEHVQAYVRLQMKRHPGVFEVHWDIDERTAPYIVPKVVIQPLVENAIFHGVQSMDGEGAIWIRIRFARETIEIRVEDNGFIPVDLHKLEQIVRGEIVDQGYGIRNVHQRVQLHFGEAYGLRYFAREGGGTAAVLTIPAMLPDSVTVRQG